jgi:hypothetical protein
LALAGNPTRGIRAGQEQQTEEGESSMRTPTPDTDECQEKWKALKIGEQLLFAYKLARLLEQQRDEARFVAYGLSGGSVGSKIEANYPLTAVWGNHYRRMILTKAKAKKEKK